MPLLRKTGVRAPWQPAPILTAAAAPADMLRPVIVIGALVPTLLLGGISQPVGGGRPLPINTDPVHSAIVVPGDVPFPDFPTWQSTVSRAPNTDPLRPTIDLQGQQPIPGASAWLPYPIREVAAAPQERLARTQLISGQTPVPGALAWIPSPARLPNTDPLRSTITQEVLPDGSLVQSATVWVGRLGRDEDTTRPARPATVVGMPPPLPGAVCWLGTPAHETPGAQSDRALQEAASVVRGQQPIPGALAQFVSRPAIVEDLGWPARPLTEQQGPTPLPGAVVRQTIAIRDQVAVLPDRLALTAVVRGQQPIPESQRVVIRPARATPTDPIRPALVLVQQPPIPGASGGLLRPPAKSTYIFVLTDATRIALVAYETRVAPVAAELRAVTVAEVRRVLVIAEVRIAIARLEDRDTIP